MADHDPVGAGLDRLRGVTVLVTIGMDDCFTELRFSEAYISYLTDAIIALRYAETGGRLAKLVSVIKVRGSAHSTDLREFRITDAGIEIEREPMQFEGLLSGHASPLKPGG